MTFRMVRFGGSVLSCGACDREGKVQRLDIFLHLLEPTTHANALRHMLGLLSRSLAERSAEGATASVAWYVVCSTQHATCYMLCDYRRMGHSTVFACHQSFMATSSSWPTALKFASVHDWCKSSSFADDWSTPCSFEACRRSTQHEAHNAQHARRTMTTHNGLFRPNHPRRWNVHPLYCARRRLCMRACALASVQVCVCTPRQANRMRMLSSVQA